MNIKKVEIIIWGIVAFVLSAILGFALTNQFNGFTLLSLNINSTTEALYFDTAQIDSLDINGIAMKVIVQEGTRENIQVNVTSPDDSRITVIQNESQLKITEKGCIGFCFGNTMVEILIPASLMETLKVETISGKIEVESVQAKNIEVKSVSGALVLEKVQFNQLNSNTTSGKIELSVNAEFESIRANSVSGKIEMKLNDVNCINLDANSVSGSIKNEYDVCQNHVVRATTTSGAIKIVK